MSIRTQNTFLGKNVAAAGFRPQVKTASDMLGIKRAKIIKPQKTGIKTKAAPAPLPAVPEKKQVPVALEKEETSHADILDAASSIMPIALRKPVYVGIATIPPRLEGLLLVLNVLAGQSTEVHVALNGYDYIPEQLARWGNVFPVLAGDGRDIPDRQDGNKFIWCEFFRYGYYFTADDDIIYPCDYVSRMTDLIDKYDGKALVGVHGTDFNIFRDRKTDAQNYLKTRYGYMFTDALDQDTVVHLLGTGTLGYDVGVTRVPFADVSAPPFGADHQLAVWAQKTCTPCITIARRSGWLQNNASQSFKQAICRRQQVRDLMNEYVYKQGVWNKYYPASPTLAGKNHLSCV